jgi:hypothetical protein
MTVNEVVEWLQTKNPISHVKIESQCGAWKVSGSLVVDNENLDLSNFKEVKHDQRATY